MVYELNVPLRVMVGKKWFACSMNNYRNTYHHILNQAKIEFQKQVQQQIFALPQMDKIKIHYEFWYQDKRVHDLNNSMAVISKFFEDSLTGADIIKDDNYLYVIGSSNSFGGIDKMNPRCQITITEV
jgi:Holliday junction resolvase RusA-like endonuclease